MTPQRDASRTGIFTVKTEEQPTPFQINTQNDTTSLPLSQTDYRFHSTSIPPIILSFNSAPPSVVTTGESTTQNNTSSSLPPPSSEITAPDAHLSTDRTTLIPGSLENASLKGIWKQKTVSMVNLVPTTIVITFELRLLRDNLSEIISILPKSNEDRNMMYFALREELSKLSSQLATCMRPVEPNDDKPKSNNEDEISKQIRPIYDMERLIKFIQMLDNTKGVRKLPRKPPGSKFCTTCLTVEHKFRKNTSEKHVLDFLNIRTKIGRSIHIVASHTDHAPGKLHYAIRNKFLNAFFSVMPSTNPLSLSAGSDTDQKQYYAFRVDKSGDYYTSYEYNEACKSSFHTAKLEFLFASKTARRNMLLVNNTIDYPQKPQICSENDLQVYI